MERGCQVRAAVEYKLAALGYEVIASRLPLSCSSYLATRVLACAGSLGESLVTAPTAGTKLVAP